MVEKKPPRNNKCQSIKMESMAPDTLYAFTFSPVDSRTFPNVGSKMTKTKNELVTETVILEQLDLWKEYLRKMKYCNFAVYPELSPTGRLHFHGFIQPRDILLFYYHDLHILNDYSYEIDTIGEGEDNHKKYADYVWKQKSLWVPLLDKHKYKYEISNIKN